MTAIEHSNYRHAFDSGFSNVSNFAEGTSVSDIQSYVDQASRYVNVTPQGANGFKLELNLQQTIGTNQTGGAANALFMEVQSGKLSVPGHFDEYSNAIVKRIPCRRREPRDSGEIVGLDSAA